MGALKDTYVQFTGGTIGFALWRPEERARQLIERQAVHRKRAKAIEGRKRAPSSADRPIIASPLRSPQPQPGAATSRDQLPAQSARRASGGCGGCGKSRQKKP